MAFVSAGGIPNNPHDLRRPPRVQKIPDLSKVQKQALASRSATGQDLRPGDMACITGIVINKQ